MADEQKQEFEGGCACGNLRYHMIAPPLVVQCCHCRKCQLDSGGGFIIHALIESSKVRLSRGRPQPVRNPKDRGKGLKVCRCPVCKTALWSHSPELGDAISYIRVGTLDEPNLLPPEIHMYTNNKLAWIVLPDNIPATPENYKRQEVWSKTSLARFEQLGYTFPQKWLQQILTPGPFNRPE